MVELYERLIESKDSEIESLKPELDALKNGSSETDNVKNIGRKAE
ncbi:hypothetical protein [Sphingobacterium hotanense]|nr:hypothetical protein [Sphingobacterium hotanense]